MQCKKGVHAKQTLALENNALAGEASLCNFPIKNYFNLAPFAITW